MDETTNQEPIEETTPQEQPETPAEEQAQPVKPSLSELLAQDEGYKSEYEQLLNAQRETWQAESDKKLDAIRIEMALDAALERAGARNNRAVLALIDRDKLTVQDGKVSGITEQLDALKQSDSYLFADNGGKPYFGASSSGGNPESGDDAVVARRYKNNPWYHG